MARRRRLLRRALPALAIVALLALVGGALVGAGPGRAERDTAEQFAALWERGDYGGMYELLDDASRERLTGDELARRYRAAAQTATIRHVLAGRVGERTGDAIPIAITVRTRVFGTVRGTLLLPVTGSGDGMRVAWRERLVFPGLRDGEQLRRDTRLPERAALLARDGQVLAEGPERGSPIPEVARHVVGRLEPAPEEQRGLLRSLGYPDDAQVGASGLERVFQAQLAGRPGGTLLAGDRVLARTEPRAAAAVRTTIDPEIERAAVAALGSWYGGVVAMDPRNGELLALAGVAYSEVQPPGSVFKIVTATGALEERVASSASRYDVVSETFLSGVSLQNANGEYCGGTLAESFAHSCNSVFGPLGVEQSPAALVDVAERYGFNRAPPIPGAAVSTIPAADDIGDDLAVGYTAIGQGKVQATALQMTSVAATIAMGGRQPVPTLALGTRPRFERVTTRAVAREIGRMMVDVVDYGTGTAAKIDGVGVAGKTGTAELRSTVVPEGAEPDPTLTDDIPDTDAWFVAYAPTRNPRVAVGVMLVEAGAGGAVAAPAAREVLVTALRRRSGG